MRSQLVVTGAMAYATYLAAICPCKKTVSCHLKPFFLSVGLATVLVAYENGVLRVLR